MPAEIPHYQDDIYVDVDWNTATDVTVLLTGWDNPLRYTQVPSQWRALPHMGEDQPVVWVQNFGSGRSMTVGLGHGVVALSRPLLKAILLRGAEWAATGSVTIPFDAEIATPMEGGDWWPTILEPQVRAMFEKWVADGEPA
jgi:type 1 glutamine amidotransferase